MMFKQGDKVKCVCDKDSLHDNCRVELTVGRIYEIISITKADFTCSKCGKHCDSVRVRGDTGHVSGWCPTRFVPAPSEVVIPGLGRLVLKPREK